MAVAGRRRGRNLGVATRLYARRHRLGRMRTELEPEDGIISVYGLGEKYTPAFTDLGIDNLGQVIENHRWAAAGYPAKSTDGP